MTHTVVTFGELLLRLSPPGFERFFQSPVLSVTFGGGEANVAASLAQFGLRSRYVTALPKHAIGEAGVRALRAEGIDTSFVVRSGDRVGIYFAETGASQRASTVIYDRARSAISEMDPGAVAWDAAMDGASWFHVTGITPALGDKARGGRREARWRQSQRRSQFQEEALVRGQGAGDDEAADARRGCGGRERRGSADGVGCHGGRRRRDQGHPRHCRIPRGRRTGD